MQLTATRRIDRVRVGELKKSLLVLKFTTVLVLTTCFFANAKGYSQGITLAEQNASLQSVFKKIRSQTGFNFVYRDEWLSRTKRVSIRVTNASLAEVMLQCLEGEPLSYEVIGNTVVIRQKPRIAEKNIIVLPDAQLMEVRGTVTDETGRPLQSVSVVVPGTPLGSMTNVKGEYSIKNVPENADLLFSYVSYESQRVQINGRSTINIVLKQEIKQLDETVVIGYGTTTKRKSTGSISSITAEEIAKQPVANPLNALQGRIAGALVTQSNGLPGSRVTVQIRGINSIDQTGAAAVPLFIIDGVPFNINDAAVPKSNDLNAFGQFAAAGGLNAFAVINPSDIERIDVLKDADATAIYGTRGANGVVLITTKKGKAGKTKFDANIYQGSGKVGHFIPMMNTQQYRQMRRQAFVNDGLTANTATAPDLFLWDSTATTDWQQKYLGGTAKITDVQGSVSGGDQRTRLYLNAGYHRETPVFPGDYNDQRVSTRLNVDHNSLDRKFNANVSLNYSYDPTNLLSRDLSTLYNLPPNLPLYNSDGSLYWNANFTNPESNRLVTYTGKAHNMMANTVLRYTVLPGLDIKTSFGFNRVQLEQTTENPALSKNPLTTSPTNSAAFATIDQKGYILEPQATYNRNIFKGRLSALLGSTFQNTLNTFLRLTGDNYSTASLLGSITGAGTTGTPAYGYTQYRYNSVFGRLTYDWASKYLFNGVLRRDGSSRFGSDKRFGTFWSLGGGWVFSSEKFAKPWSFLSFGKLRASYGLTGNDQIGDYLYSNFFTTSATYQNNATLVASRIDNSKLHWQNTYKLEFGLDLTFLNRRVELTTNYYHNRTPDQLGFLTLSSQTGFNSYASNFDALIQNTGLEFELRTQNLNGRDIKWSSSFNITIPRTKLISASPNYFFYNPVIIGQPLSVALRYHYVGVNPATGRPLYQSLPGDSATLVPNLNTDRLSAGYTAPKLYGGLNNVLNYKNLEFSFFFQFTKQSGNIYPSAAPGVLTNGNQPTYWLSSTWIKTGDANVLPKYTTTSSVYSNYGQSDAVWGDASFVRLRTVNISYQFPQSLISRLKLENVRMYLQGQNLWWASKNKYVYDPETGTAMPPLRVITAGINVTL